MARNSTQKFEPVITLNSKAAEDALEGLKIRAKQVRDALNEAGKAGDTKKVKELDRELRSISSSQRLLRTQTYDYNNVLKSLNTSTIKALEKASRALKNEIKELTPGTEQFVAKSKQLELVRGRLDHLNGRVKETHNWLSRAGNTFNKYWGILTAAAASVAGISMSLRGAAQEAAKMDDIYSDVMKTTGLLREEVVELNEEFKKLNTRTSREDLNALARDAGKLGISAKEDVLQFVRAANQINVALGEDLGEGAIRNIGKISEVFQKTKELGIEKAFLSIGSAINALGQASTASEQYLVDFTQRLSGASYQAGLSVQDLLGWGSALDQTGNKVEMAATAFQNFIMKMFADTSTFAKIAGVSLQDFSSLLQTDVNQAIITVLTAMREKGGFAQLVPIFKEMGTDGARAISVLSSLANNLGLVTEAQKLSNIEYQKATSLTNEYNVKNENMQAQLEKAKKKFKDQVITLGEQLSPAFLKSTNAGTLFLKFLMSLNKEIVYSVVALTGAYIAYRSWNTIVSFGRGIMAAARAANLLFAASMALVTGNTVRATIAWNMFKASLNTTVIFAVLAAITALGYGLYKLITYQTELEKATRNFYAETAKAERSAGQLLDVLRKSAVGSREYKEALEALQRDYGPYINSLIDEKGALNNIETARVEINKAIAETIALRIQEQSINDIATRAIEKQAIYYQKMVSVLIKQGGLSEDLARITAKSFTEAIKSGKSMSDAFSVVEKKIEKTKSSLFNKSAFINFVESYSDMVTDIAQINKEFDFYTPSDNSFNVPIPGGESSADFKARRLEEEKKKKKIEADIAAMTDEEREKQFKKELERIEEDSKKILVILKQGLYEQTITQQDYEDASLINSIAFLEKKLQLHKKYAKSTADIEAEYYDSLQKGSQSAIRRAEEADKIGETWLRKLQNYKDEIWDEDKEIERIIKESQEKHQKMRADAQKIHEEFENSTWKKELKRKKAELKESYEAQLITTEQYEWKMSEIRIEYATKMASAINDIVSSIAELYNTIRDAEFAKLERQKEEELRLYGDSADKRAEIEQKYEQQKLELQVEYADKDMAVKILQTMSAGALAIMQAWATLPTPVAAVMTGVIAGINAMQIATIVAQRNALKSSFQSNSGSGVRNINVDGYHDGGFTDRDYSDKKPVGVVHANEWVAPAQMVRANPLVFASLEKERVSKYTMYSPVKQYASGGFTSPQSGDSAQMREMLKELAMLLKSLRDNPIRGYVVLSDINQSNDLVNRLKEEGSL